MRRILFLIAVLAGIVPDQAHTQATAVVASRNFLGVTGEAGLVSFREDLLVPLSFSGPGFALGGSFAHRSDGSLLDLDLSMRISYGINRFDHEAISLSTRIRSAWLWNIRSGGRLGELWIGAVLPFRINDMYIFSWDDAHMYWITSYGMGPAIQWRSHYSSETTIAVGMDLPVVHLVSRPPSYRFDKQDGMNRFFFWLGHPQRSFQLEPIGSYTAITLHGTMEWRSAESFSSLGLQIRFSRMDGDKPEQDLNTLIVYSYRWGL